MAHPRQNFQSTPREEVRDWSDHLTGAQVEENLNLIIIGPTRTLKIQGFDHK